jgi:hypothetical protein
MRAMVGRAPGRVRERWTTFRSTARSATESSEAVGSSRMRIGAFEHVRTGLSWADWLRPIADA